MKKWASRSAIVLGMLAASGGLLQCRKSKSTTTQTGDGGSLGQKLQASDLAVSATAAAGKGGAAGTGEAEKGAGAGETAGARAAGGSACGQFNNGGPCTPTEQRFVDKSVDCYQCVVNAGCLDDAKFNDKGHECGDLTGNAAAGTAAGTSRTQLCLDTLDCIFDSRCAATDVTICYCGSLGAGNACAIAPVAAVNGVCLNQEVAGLELGASTSPLQVLPSYTDLARGAGIANQLFFCAKSNSCDKLCSR